MSRDFTLSKYKELCYIILDKYDPLTVKEYLEKPSKKKVAVLRHDVDRFPIRALRMAELEHSLGISSSYYFRYPTTFNVDVIRKISRLGHEVGYHYECMGKARCDPQKAIGIFKRELKKFQDIGIDIKTICAHGQPLIKCSNTDLWTHYDFKDFGIIGEAFLSFRHLDITYFSDTGRTWGESLFKSFKNDQNIYLKSTHDLIYFLDHSKLKRVYILTHPERWPDSIGGFLISLISDSIFNLGKKVIKNGKR